jgi:hypothetical protein
MNKIKLLLLTSLLLSIVLFIEYSKSTRDVILTSENDAMIEFMNHENQQLLDKLTIQYSASNNDFHDKTISFFNNYFEESHAMSIAEISKFQDYFYFMIVNSDEYRDSFFHYFDNLFEDGNQNHAKRIFNLLEDKLTDSGEVLDSIIVHIISNGSFNSLDFAYAKSSELLIHMNNETKSMLLESVHLNLQKNDIDEIPNSAIVLVGELIDSGVKMHEYEVSNLVDSLSQHLETGDNVQKLAITTSLYKILPPEKSKEFAYNQLSMNPYSQPIVLSTLDAINHSRIEVTQKLLLKLEKSLQRNNVSDIELQQAGKVFRYYGYLL